MFRKLARFILLRVPLSLGFPSVAFRCYDDKPSRFGLKGLRCIISFASKSGDTSVFLHYLAKARELYPSNSFAYIESSSFYLSQGQIADAKAALDGAPFNAAVERVRQRVASQEKRLSPVNKARPPIKAAEPKAPNVEGVGKKIQSYDDWKTYSASLEGRNVSADVMRLAPASLKRTPAFHFATAAAAVRERRPVTALAVLSEAQRHIPGDKGILNRIGDLYRDDGQASMARTYYKAVNALDPVYGITRLLAHEADRSNLEAAASQYDKIGSLTPEQRLRYAETWSRVASLFPTYAVMTRSWRKEARLDFQKSKPTTVSDLNRLVKLGVKLRWINETKVLIDLSATDGLVPDDYYLEWFNSINDRLGVLGEVIDLATRNEESAASVGLLAGVPVTAPTEQTSTYSVVEFFIAGTFFASPDHEKPSFETVRKFMSDLAGQLLTRENVVVVPRHQYNWRHADVRAGIRAISYHTFASPTVDRLHVQETPLAGTCSVDKAGFASFSSIASSYSSIIAATKDLDVAVLLENQQELYERYVKSNQSKYAQSETAPEIVGRFVFIPLQITTDVVADRAYLSSLELVRTVAHHYNGTGVKVVVKRHPYCNSMTVERTLIELEEQQLIETSDASIHVLIDGCDAVFTINSGVGLEALIHLKPVVVAGAADYAYAVTTVVDVAELNKVLEATPRLDRRRTLEFLYYYNRHYAMSPSPAAAKGVLGAWLNP